MSAENIEDYLVEIKDDADANGSSEREDAFVGGAVNVGDSSGSLEGVAKDDIITSLVNALRIELVDFEGFTGRNTYLYFSRRTGNIANYTEPPLLLIGLVAILREIQLRYKEYHENEADRFPAIVGGVVAVSKLLTVISFSVADYFYLRDNPSIIPDKIAGIFFIALFVVETVMDSLMSAHYPGNDYRSVAFSIMAFLKANLVAAALLQFFEKTELPGLIMAAVLFPAILLNLERFSRYYHQAKVEGSSAPAVMPVRGRQSVNVDEESHLLSPVPALIINQVPEGDNPQPVILSNSRRLTFLEGLRQRVARVPAYIMGEDLSERAMSPR